MTEKGYVSARGLGSTQTRLWRSAFAITAFAVTLGGQSILNTFGVWVLVAAFALVLIWGATLFALVRPERFRWYRLPAPVIFVLLFTAISLFWAQDLQSQAIDFVGQIIATVLAITVAYLLTWQETLRTLASALRFLLTGLLIIWLWQTLSNHEDPTVSLSLISVIALTVFSVQAAAGLVRPFLFWFWFVVAALALVLAASPVAYIALGVVAISLIFVLWVRSVKPDNRMPIYFIGLLALGATIAVIVWWRAELMPSVGIDPEKIATANVFSSVLAKQGGFGLALFVLLVFVTTWRVWFRAVDQPRRGAGAPLPYALSAIWPFLVTMSLLVFSLVAATLVTQAGWFLLILFAIKTRFDYIVPQVADDTKKLKWRDVPLAGVKAAGL